MCECVLKGILSDGPKIKLQTSHNKVIKCSAIIISVSCCCYSYRDIPSKWRDDRKSLISVILSSAKLVRGRQDIWQEVNSMVTHHYLRKCNFHTVHTLHHTLWLNTMLMREWDSWRLQWWRDLLTENHIVAWAVKTTYDEKKYVEYSSDGKWGKHTHSLPHKHKHIHIHTQKAIMLSMVRRICDWLLCVFTCCLSLLSPHLSVSTITPSLRVSFSLSFFLP